jgi:orotidine-5'-phosphate decarboxylase
MAPALPPVFVAIDTPDLELARSLCSSLQVPGLGIKLGLEFFCAHGAAGVRSVLEAAGDLPLFLDLKFHDIPNTVAGAVRATTGLGAALLNVHAGGGAGMMKAAVTAATEEAQRLGVPKPAMLAVTVLTSMDDSDLKAVGQTPSAREQVVRLALLAKECGMDGVVCSAVEISAIRAACGPEFALVVPGIRPAGAAMGDQKRVMTPADAMAAGATSLVVGRPITTAEVPKDAAARIVAEARGAA